jgi:hypothetical protein
VVNDNHQDQKTEPNNRYSWRGRLGCLTIIIIFALGFWLLNKHDRAVKQAREIKRDQEQQAKKQHAEEIEAAISEVASRHNAITNWEDNLKTNLYEELYTVEVKEHMLGDKERPLLFRSFVIDIDKNEEFHLILFGPERIYRGIQLNPNFYYKLRCNEQQAKEIIKNRNKKFAVVAFFYSVKRMEFKLFSDAPENFVRDHRSLLIV